MNELDNLRTHPNAWTSVSFSAHKSDDRGTFDGNERHRLRVLLALQYDCRESDVALVRHLFTHEIIAAENDSFQGCEDSLILAALLLARFKDPTDLPLFARAKLANFDTACGFPRGFLFVACGDQTEQYFKTNHPAIWDELLDALGVVAIAPDRLDAWWQSINRVYPVSEEDEHLLSLYERALSFNNEPLAREYLNQWIAQEPDSESKRRKLKYEYTQLGEFGKAAEIVVSELENCEELWDKASGLEDLVKLYRQAGNFSSSLDAARQLDATFATFDGWIGVGLGRMAIHEVFELSQMHPGMAGACEAFTLADNWFQRSRDLAFVGLEAAVKAAQRCGWSDKETEYQQLATAERQRIDNM